MKKFIIRCFGCSRRDLDGERIKNFLVANGLNMTAIPQEAGAADDVQPIVRERAGMEPQDAGQGQEEGPQGPVHDRRRGG